jgi:hypothetical protein
MTAADALTAATAAGVTVTLSADGSLMLKADVRPPASVVAALRQHKADVITLLSGAPPKARALVTCGGRQTPSQTRRL